MQTPSEDQRRAARAAIRKERARDADRAMRDYKDEKRALIEKTERLRALRLAKSAEDAGAKTAKKSGPAKKAR